MLPWVKGTFFHSKEEGLSVFWCRKLLTLSKIEGDGSSVPVPSVFFLGIQVLYQVCIAHFRGPMHASTSHQRWLHWSGKLQGQLHLRFKSYLSLQSRIYSLGYVPKLSQCLKIVQKVAFNNTSEASYVYILSGQKFIKSAKSGQFRLEY